MATQADLMGVGMPAAQAQRLGNSPATITCTGTSAGTAKLINSKMFILSASASNTGAIFPDGSFGVVYFGSTSSTTSAVVYPPSGGTISGASSVTIAQNKNALFWNTDHLTFWYLILP